MGVTINAISLSKQVKELVEKNRFDLTLPLINNVIEEIKERKSLRYLKSILSSISDEDAIYIIRALDAALLNKHCNFLTRYRHKYHASPITAIHACYDDSEKFNIVDAEESLVQIINKEDLDQKTLKQAYNALIHLLIEMRRFGDAKRFLEEYEAIAERSFQDHWGNYYFRLGEWEKAETLLRQGITEDDRPQYSFLTLQLLYSVQGNLDEALNTIELGIIAVPGYLPLYLEKANKLRQLQRWNEYHETINLIDELSPQHNLLHFFQYTRGVSHYFSSDYFTFKKFITEHERLFKQSPFETCESNTPENIHSFPFRAVIQKSNYCVPATVSMLLSRYGVDKDQDEIAEHIFELDGSSLHKTVNYLQSIGMTCKYFFGSVPLYKELTDAEMSVIICVDYPGASHVQLLRGYDENLHSLMIQDPNSSERHTVTYLDFEKYYSNNQYLSIAVVPQLEKLKLDNLNQQDHELVAEMLAHLNLLENANEAEMDELLSIINNNLDNVYVLANAIKVLHLFEQPELLLEVSKKLTSLFPESDYFRLIASNALIKIRRFDEATQHLQNVKLKQSHFYFYNLGRLAIEDNRFLDAAQYFKEAINREPDHYDTWSFLALAHFYNDDNHTALKYSKASLDINNQDFWNRLNHGKILFEEQNYSEARSLYSVMIKDFKRNAPVWFERARCDQELGKFQQALRGYRVAKQLDPKVEYPYREIAGIYLYHNHDPERAEAELKEGLSRAEGKQPLLVALGDLYEGQENYREAVSWFEAALKHDEKDAYSLLALARVKYEMAQQQEGLELLKSKYDSFSEDCNYLMIGGKWIFNHYCEADCQELALDMFEKGLSLADRNLDDAWNMYVELVGETSYNERGQSFLNRQLETRYQGNIDLICYIGCLYENDGQFERAIELYQQALKIKEARFPLYRLAEVAFNRNQEEEAKRYYNASLSIDEDFVPAYFRLADIANRGDNPIEEQANLFEVLKRSPLDVEMSYFAELSNQLSILPDVVSHLTHLKGEVNESWRLYAMAQCASVEGDLAVEADCLEQALEIEPSNFLLLNSYSLLLVKQGQQDEAISIILRLIRMDLEERELYQNLVNIYFDYDAVSPIEELLNGIEASAAEKSRMYMYTAYAVEQYFLQLKNESVTLPAKLGWKKRLKTLEKQMKDLYEKSNEVDHANVRGLVWLYDHFASQGRLPKAIKGAESVLDKGWNLEMARFYSQLIVSLYAENEHRKKLQEYNRVEVLLHKCLEEEPLDAVVHYTLGRLYMYRGQNQYDKAKYHLETALEIDPTDLDYYLECSKLYLNHGACDRAMEIAMKAAELNPQDLKVLIQIGIIKHRQGNTVGALALMDEILEINGDFLSAHYNKACYLSCLGQDLEGAYYHLKFAIKNDENIDYYKNYAKYDTDLNVLRNNKLTKRRMKKLLYSNKLEMSLFWIMFISLKVLFWISL